MKALKEKRINLRSLWRMGLVILSVLALAFVGCAKTDGDSPGTTDPGNGGNTGPAATQSRVIPTGFSIAENPASFAGALFEGQTFDLTGMVLNVRFSDNSSQLIPFDPSKMTIFPAIYDGRFGNPNQNPYQLTYADNGAYVTVPLYVPNGVMRLVDLDITGNMHKQDYLIDEIPNFYGLTVYGRYSNSVSSISHPPGRFPIPDIRNSDPNNSRFGGLPSYVNEQDVARYPIPLTTDMNEYRWAWVWNEIPGKGSFIADKPGVLLSIGSYGNILSRIVGRTDSILDDPFDPTETTPNILTGSRVPIQNLYNVARLDWATEPSFSKNQIFYDDPRLISAVSSRDEYDARMATWFDYAFSDGSINVTYDNGDVRKYTIPELRAMSWVFGVIDQNSISLNAGIGATWADLSIYPISYANKMIIDVTRDNKPINMTRNNAVPNLYPFDWNSWSKGEDSYGYYLATTHERASDYDPTTQWSRKIVGDGGWAQWAQLATGRSVMRITWRSGKSLDIAIPIYNRPSLMEVSVQTRVVLDTETQAVVMNGFDAVHRPPEGMGDFLNKLVIRITYVKQGGASTDNAVREDLVSDMNLGKCRKTISWPDNNNNLPGGQYRWMTMNSLYSTNVYNFLDWGPAVQLDANGNPVLDANDVPVLRDRPALGADMKEVFSRLNFRRWLAADDRQYSDTFDETDFLGTDAEGSLYVNSVLTKDRSTRFLNRNRTVAGRVEYVGWAGDPTRTRTVNNRTIQVGPLNYKYNWLDTDDDFRTSLKDLLVNEYPNLDWDSVDWSQELDGNLEDL